ncbi:hypothetical protein PsYK624_084040 [Phanerochaete sordida]|uniref:Uncharacterized protein n=1 Tax=Phanerochaete sordida TaxID=48140 RepID=A0A9P3GCI2_9APHY|nr:hypothetical protein PsYK624_084040 [Phanerochaete sordida]
MNCRQHRDVLYRLSPMTPTPSQSDEAGQTAGSGTRHSEAPANASCTTPSSYLYSICSTIFT